LGVSGKVPTELGLGKFMQFGFVIKSTEKTLEYYEKTLGLGRFDSSIFGADTDHGRAKMRISLAQSGGVQFELIEPMEGDTIHSAFLKQGRQGLHHLGFNVKDLDEKVKELQKKGIKPLERGKMLDAAGKSVGVQYVYLDTTSTFGMILELLKF
jgi:catechol 2,3-dioxygenase-like lactoylglutathione lyase family enzyme